MIKKIMSFVLGLLFFTSLYGLDQEKAGLIITPINGLSITSSAGLITITNASGQDISVSTMLLSFSLDQANIPSVWGTPWLNWQPFSPSSKTPLNYQFVNQVPMPNSKFNAGSSISFQYSPSPWSNTAAPSNIQLFNLSYPLNPTPINWSNAYSNGVNTITIINNSGT